MLDLLSDISVVEISGELNGYTGRLLADLGARVTLVDIGATPLAEHEHRFLHHGKVAAPGDELLALLETADVVIFSGGADAPDDERLTPEALRVAAPDAIVTVLTPFGLEGPCADCVSTDLTRLAAGGLLWLGGYPDGEPVAPYGGQSSVATGIFGAVAILLALIDRDAGGRPGMIEVSAQEVLTQALETALPDFELTGTIRRRVGGEPREAGTGIYPCEDGYVSMVAGRLGTAEAWTRLREWLVEENAPGAGELWADGWNELAYRQRPESIARFSEIFGAIAHTRTKRELYHEAQRRSIALAPVNSPAEVLADEQLASRGFFHDGVLAPPYRISIPVPLPVDQAAPAPT
jgi:benzylsuccinate CoA-transferase BbsE subunit